MQIDEIRDIVVKHARLSASPGEIHATTDLYSIGLSSLTTVHLMLALEEHFEVEFPDKMLGRKTFESLQSLSDAIDEMRG